MRRAARVDANQPEIVQALRNIGCVVIIVSQLKNAFDILVAYRGKLHVMEIKDGSKTASQKQLTLGEISCKKALENVGVQYNVVESVSDAIKIVTKT